MLNINLKGKKVFIAGVADDKGFGWAIAKVLAEAGAEIIIGTWPPVYNIFLKSLSSGKIDQSFNIAKIYPLDAAFDSSEDVPEEIKQNKRYQCHEKYTISEIAEEVKKDFGTIDILVHSLANGPEAQKPLLETSREGYLAAVSVSSYSFVSLVSHFGPIMNEGGAALTLSYIAAEKVVPGYGGGLNAAKAALESDTRYLAWEAGRKWGMRVNAISAGPLGSRAAKAIGFIDKVIAYSEANAPMAKSLNPIEVGHTAAFLLSPLATAITGETIFVDNGLHIMGVATDSPCFI
ncbi:MAG: Enoyl-[acyl-carrier-protein] reductase [NADH] FabI [Chlamydiae bacterium]|nr:Enoyl-[acyl-carrier-protein] reductase [NADH] FabI [Chlamydiota bacterium]